MAKSFWRNWFFLFFAYSLGVSLLIQCVLLPYVFPQWHAGNGLLKGHDWVTYHLLAREMADHIRDYGWGEWTLYSNFWLEPGVLGGLYALGIAKPYVLLPFNAFIHALTGILIAHLIQILSGTKKRMAILAAFPFVFFPTALMWVAQVHKDGLSFLGTLLFLWGWMFFLSQSDNRKISVLAMCGILLGVYLNAISRPYLGVLFWSFSLFFSFLFFGKKVFSWVLLFSLIFFKKGYFYFFKGPRRTERMGSVLLIVLLLYLQKNYAARPYGETSLPQSAVQMEAPAPRPVESPSETLTETPSTGLEGKGTNLKMAEQPKVVYVPTVDTEAWTRTPEIPEALDIKLYSLARVRGGFSGTYTGNSNFDTHVRFLKAEDVLRYQPRALQIAFFAPFPKDWFAKASTDYNAFFRKLVGLEILFIYFSFPFMIFAFWKFRNRMLVFCTVLFLSAFLALYASTTPNLGTLHRFRFLFITIFAGIGFYQAALVFLKASLKAKASIEISNEAFLGSSSISV